MWPYQQGNGGTFMITKLCIFLLVFSSAAGVAWSDQTKTDVVERLQSSTTSLHQILAAPDKGIPDEVFKGAKCIAVVPGLVKGGFIIAAKHGRGVATCRLPNGGWSAPAFFTISGGSWGAQIGVESVDLVMMIMNDQGMRHLLGDKFQMGGEAAAAAGPVGRHAEAGTDWKVESQMLTYSRSKGLFVGIDLAGSLVERDKDSTIAFYGKDFTTKQILTGKVVAPAEARPFLAEVRKAKRVTARKS
jgi:SH3 domain-containing YSC84-like protein 1